MQYDKLKDVDVSDSASEKNITYKAKTTIGGEEFSSNLKINIKSEQEHIDMKYVKGKIDELHEVVVDFKNSSLMKELERAEPVRSPIRKTNAILKDVQLNKCLELWEILEQLQNSIKFDSEYMENSLVDENELSRYLDLMNNRPRKCLKYKTPNEVINEHSLHQVLHLI